MTHWRRLLAACALACAVTISVSAGEISCGRTSEVDEVSASASAVCGDISCGVTPEVNPQEAGASVSDFNFHCSDFIKPYRGCLKSPF